MDCGFSIGGPVGRPGGQNKLFFYFNLEANPRTFGGDVNRYRVPTALERQGDFSQSRDNLGNPYPYIKDPLIAGTCSAADTRACFQDGGVLGRIPPNRLYQTRPQHPEVVADAEHRRSRRARPTTTRASIPKIDLLGYQPVIRVDYQPTPSIRGSFKFLEYQQPSKVHPRHHPRLQRHAGTRLRHLAAGRHVQLDDQPDDVRRGVVRRQLPPPGRLLDHRRRAELLPHRPAA